VIIKRGAKCAYSCCIPTQTNSY